MDYWKELMISQEQAQEIRCYLDTGEGFAAPLHCIFDDGVTIIVNFPVDEQTGQPFLTASLIDAEVVARIHPPAGGDFAAAYEFFGIEGYETYALNITVEDEEPANIMYSTEGVYPEISEMYAAFQPGTIQFAEYWLD